MGSSRADIILHPVRTRVLMAVIGKRMTEGQIAADLSDVPQATLYRQINRLREVGVLEVVEEVRVRGTVEKVYEVPKEAGRLTLEDLAQATREDHQRYFTQFMMTILSQFNAYLQQETIDFARDGVAYNTIALNLTEEEARTFSEEFRAAVTPYLEKEQTPERRRWLVHHISIPDRKEQEKT